MLYPRRLESKNRPPAISIDLHEDNLISEGYVYSQGVLGTADPLALIAVLVFETPADRVGLQKRIDAHAALACTPDKSRYRQGELMRFTKGGGMEREAGRRSQ